MKRFKIVEEVEVIAMGVYSSDTDYVIPAGTEICLEEVREECDCPTTICPHNVEEEKIETEIGGWSLDNKDQPLTPKDVGLKKVYVMEKFMEYLDSGFPNKNLMLDEEFDRLYQEFLREKKGEI